MFLGQNRGKPFLTNFLDTFVRKDLSTDEGNDAFNVYELDQHNVFPTHLAKHLAVRGAL